MKNNDKRRRGEVVKFNLLTSILGYFRFHSNIYSKVLALILVFISIYLFMNLNSIGNLVSNVSNVTLIKCDYTVSATNCEDLSLNIESVRNVLQDLDSSYVINFYPLIDQEIHKLPLDSIEIIMINTQGDYAKIAIYNDGKNSVILNGKNYLAVVFKPKQVSDLFYKYFK